MTSHIDVETLLATLTPEVYERLSFGAETGRWPDGTPLNDVQKAQAIQLVMLYQSRNNDEAQHMSVKKGGEICTKSKQELKRAFSKETPIETKTIDLEE